MQKGDLVDKVVGIPRDSACMHSSEKMSARPGVERDDRRASRGV